MTRLLNIKYLLIGMFILCLTSTVSYSQNYEKKGDAAWAEGRYKTAVNNYGKVKNLKKDKKLLAKRGLGFFKLNRLNKAIDHFTLAKKLGNKDADLYWYMAQAKHHLNEYEEAAFFYKSYVKEVGEKSDKAKLALREMKNCAFSAFEIGAKSSGVIQPFGDEVNTYYDEVYPMQSPRFGNLYYFTSNRNLKDMEVYSYEIDAKGHWEHRKDFGSGINTAANEYVMDISPDGQSMLYVIANGEEHNNKIYVSTYYEEEQHIIELPDYLIDGAMDLQIIDYNSIAFASKELGGYGGYDIFTINYKNNIWSDPLNAGEEINTAYDERSPFYATTGEYLYYSSNRPYCYGGFDVYYHNTLSVEVSSINMGKPVNSSGDDLQFRLNEDGQMAIMSSDRKSGEGSFDIYMVYMNTPKPMPAKSTKQLAYVKDYIDRLNPQEVVVEEPKSHLEKLKEKLDIDDEEIAEKEVEVGAVTDDVQDEFEEVSSSDESKATKEEEVLVEVKENVQERNNSKKTEDGVQIVDMTGTKSKEEDSGIADVEDNGSSQEEPGVKVKEEETSLEKIAETTGNEEMEEDEIEEESENSSGKEVTQQEPPINKSEETGIPHSDYGDSPLSSIQKKAKEQALAPSINAIDGSVINNALFYQDRHDLMNDVNKGKVQKLKRYLKDNPQHSVHIIAHTDHLEPGLPEFMQYNTLKRANLIARVLLDEGLSKNNISIESVSGNYPLVKPTLAGEPNSKYLAYNKRIDFEIRNEDNQIIQSHNISSAKIPGYALDRKYDLYTQIREELYYSVEIGNHKHIFKNAVLRLYSDIYIRKPSPVANNRYYIGLYTNYDDALELQKELAESSAPYAKIVPFYQGMPIKKSMLDNISKDYPDLEKFITDVK